jgi:hypothetical protein
MGLSDSKKSKSTDPGGTGGSWTYMQPETVTDRECLLIIASVVRGIGPVTEEKCALVTQKVLDMLHAARIDQALISLVIDGKVDIDGINEAGEIVFRKIEAK